MTKEPLFSLTKKDFVIQTFRCGGPGGQNVNKVETGVRIIHSASGAVGESRSERSQLTNKKLAFQRLIKTKKFQAWFKLETARRLTGKSIDDWVNDQMASVNLKIEVMDSDGNWVISKE